MLFCTIAANNYLAKALNWAACVHRHHPDASVVLCVAERECCMPSEARAVFDRIVIPHDLGIDPLDQFAFRHDVIEFATAIKARLLLRVQEWYPRQSQFVYMDPDVEVFRPVTEVETALENDRVLVTPHHLADLELHLMLPMMKLGVFNLGFIGIGRGSHSNAFLQWWDDKLSRACYMQPEAGLFVDQKWVDLACGMFDLTVLRDPTYNVAYWNIARRPVRGDLARPSVHGRPVAFIHFSGVGSPHERRCLDRWAVEWSLMRRLRERHIERTDGMSLQYGCHDERWTYGCYRSGEAIARAARVEYRISQTYYDADMNPYDMSNEYFADEAKRHSRGSTTR